MTFLVTSSIPDGGSREELDLPKLDFAIAHREGLPELLREKRPT